MSSDKTLNTKITFEVDNASLNRASSAYASLGNDLDALTQQQEQYEKKQRQIQKNAAESRAFEQQARQSFSASGGGAPAGRNIGGGNTDLSKLSSSVTQIADLSNGIDVGSITGAVSGFGDLGSEIKSLPSAFSGLLSSISPTSLALGVATVAIAAVGVAFAAFIDEANKQAEQLNRAIDSRRDALQFVAGGGTADEANKRAEALRKQADAERQILTELEAQYRSAEEQLGVLSGIAQVLSPQEDALSSQIAASRQAVAEYEAQANSFERLVQTGATAQNDLNTSLLERASLVQESILIEASANESTAESNRERLRQLDIQTQAIEAELEVLESAETQSAETTARIDQLQASLKALGNEAGVVSQFTTQTAKDVENANKKRLEDDKELAEERERLADETIRKEQQAMEQRANALNDLNNKLVDAAKKNADAEADIAKKLNDSRSDARRQLNRDLQSLDVKESQERVKLITTTQNDEAKSAREHQRNLEKIQRDAQRQREDLASNLDFAGIFQLDRNTNTQLIDASGEYDAAREERRFALDEQLADLKLSAMQARQERQVAYRNELQDLRIQANRENRDRVTQYNRELELAQTAYSRQLKLLAEKFTAETRLYQQFADRTSTADGAPRARGGDIGFAPTQGVIGRAGSSTTTNANTIAINVNGARNASAVSAEVRDELRKLGFG